MQVLTHTISNKTSGQKLDPHMQIIELDVFKTLNRIPYAELTLADGDIARQTFDLSESGFFNLGDEIEIKLRWEGITEDIQIFSGILVKQHIEADESGSLLTIKLKDKAIKATQLRKSTLHKEQSDADIFSLLISQNGLKEGDIAKTQPVHPELIQFNCTDWDFLVLRAEAQGLWVNVDDGEVSIQPAKLDAKEIGTLEYGMSPINSFALQSDASYHFDQLKTRHWDLSTQELADNVAESTLKLTQGKKKALFEADKLAEALGTSEKVLFEPFPAAIEESNARLKGLVERNRLARFQGTISIPGIGGLKPLDVIKLAGMGDRFNGKSLITGVRHTITSEESWTTELQLGLEDISFAEQFAASPTSTTGLITETQGLYIGVVAEFEKDETGEWRVRINLPGISEGASPVWARLSSPDAGKGHGFFFRPEMGDEVIIGFLGNDPRHAIVLGALYSSANAPFEDWAELDEKNEKKGLISKSGTLIEFVDGEKSKLRIQTPAESVILLDDEAKSIELKDAHGNSIVMNADGIVLTSAKDLKLEASGKVEISGASVDVK